jgi:hypothetical protein
LRRTRRRCALPAAKPAGNQRRFDLRCGYDHHRYTSEVGRGEIRCARCSRRERHAEIKARTVSRLARDADCAAHALDDAPGNGKAKTGAAVSASRGSVGLFEVVKDARLIFRPETDAGVAHLEADADTVLVRLGGDGDAARVGELDGVAGEIEQHLAQSRWIADDIARQALVDEGGDLDTLGLRARPEQFDHAFEQRGEREWSLLEVELAGLDLGKIENLFDQRQQRLTGGLRRPRIGFLLGRQRGVEQQVGHAENAVERRADFVADGGEKVRLGAIGRISMVACLGKRPFGVSVEVSPGTATSRQAIHLCRQGGDLRPPLAV